MYNGDSIYNGLCYDCGTQELWDDWGEVLELEEEQEEVNAEKVEPENQVIEGQLSITELILLKEE